MAYVSRDQGRSPPPAPAIVAPERLIGVKDGAYAEIDGRIVIRNDGTFQPVTLSAADAARVRGVMQVGAFTFAVHYIYMSFPGNLSLDNAYP